MAGSAAHLIGAMCWRARSAASELREVALTEALELVLLMAREEPGRFGRAVLRWQGRYCREHREIRPDEAQALLALLLAGPRSGSAAKALAALLDRRGYERVCETLYRAAEKTSTSGPGTHG